MLEECAYMQEECGFMLEECTYMLEKYGYMLEVQGVQFYARDTPNPPYMIQTIQAEIVI